MAAVPNYVVYIDEAGDPGIKQKPASALGGASEWFVVAAVVVRECRDRDTVTWVRDMREAVRAQGRPQFTTASSLHPIKVVCAGC